MDGSSSDAFDLDGTPFGANQKQVRFHYGRRTPRKSMSWTGAHTGQMQSGGGVLLDVLHAFHSPTHSSGSSFSGGEALKGRRPPSRKSSLAQVIGPKVPWVQFVIYVIINTALFCAHVPACRTVIRTQKHTHAHTHHTHTHTHTHTYTYPFTHA